MTASTRFKKGQSGNPNGRPRGARNKTTVAAEALLDGDAEAITSKAIELAKDGDTTAMRLCLERIVPPRRDRRIEFGMRAIESVTDAVGAAADIVGAMSGGQISPSEASELMRVVDSFARIVQVSDHEARLRQLEGAA